MPGGRTTCRSRFAGGDRPIHRLVLPVRGGGQAAGVALYRAAGGGWQAPEPRSTP